MKIGVAPANTRTCTAAIRHLLQASTTSDQLIQVKAWYRDTAKAPADLLSHPSFEAVRGDVSDASSLDFDGCDAIITVPPPFFTKEDMVSLSEDVARNIKSAIEKTTTVKRLVMMSSIGAHLTDGVGEIKTKTAAEKILVTTDIPRITVIRPAYFMENWAAQHATLTAAEPSMFTYLTPLDWRLEMVSLQDVGRAAASEASTQKPQADPVHIYEIQGPKREGYSSLEARDVLSRIVGRDIELRGIEKDKLPEFFGSFLPAGCVPMFVEMASSFLEGGALDMTKRRPGSVVYGETSLEAALEEAMRAQGEASA